MDKHAAKFKIDPEFKHLIPPLGVDEYRQLEQNILAEGCHDALTVWNGVLLDGHNRFEICTKHHIPYEVNTISLSCREEAVAWICKNQLGRRNISEETRKYLIGKRYESEKIVGTHNHRGANQHAKKKDSSSHPKKRRTNSKTAYRLGSEYHISHTTVNKYGTYARALDKLNEKGVDIVPKILSGQIKLSHDHVLELSTLPESEVSLVCEQLHTSSNGDISYSEARERLQGKQSHKSAPTGLVKSMPAYDPDSEISSLALTIPSWISSIRRTRELANLLAATQPAKRKLTEQLTNLCKTATDMIQAIEEANHG